MWFQSAGGKSYLPNFLYGKQRRVQDGQPSRFDKAKLPKFGK